jgi:hypothetical protein
MNAMNKNASGFKYVLYCFLVLALSCTDHEIEGNLPESQCKATDGSDRLYPCEFVIEKITFLAKDGTDLGSVTGSSQTTSLSRFQAKTNSYAGNVVGQTGSAVFDVKMTLKRIASPSFPVRDGYLIGLTHNTAGKQVLHTPSFAGDTYGERSKIGAPIALDMAIGESRDVVFETSVPYSIVDAGSAGIVPNALFTSTSFFVDNDVTTLMFNRDVDPYRYVGSVVEAYYEKLRVNITN